MVHNPENWLQHLKRGDPVWWPEKGIQLWVWKAWKPNKKTKELPQAEPELGLLRCCTDELKYTATFSVTAAGKDHNGKQVLEPSWATLISSPAVTEHQAFVPVQEFGPLPATPQGPQGSQGFPGPPGPQEKAMLAEGENKLLGNLVREQWQELEQLRQKLVEAEAKLDQQAAVIQQYRRNRLQFFHGKRGKGSAAGKRKIRKPKEKS